MFILSKLFSTLVQPGNALLLLLCLGLVLIAAGRRRIGLGFAGAAAALLVAIAVLPVGTVALAPLEDRFPQPQALPERVNGIIVLGGLFEPDLSAARGTAAINGSVERMLAFAALAERYPEATLVFTGGSGSVFLQEFKEAAVARDVSARFGLAGRDVIWESGSRNTHENAVLSKALVRPDQAGTWILVTSAWHMPRAVGTFRTVGWPVLAYPTDYSTAGDDRWTMGFDLDDGLTLLTVAVHEWVGLVAYRLLGRTDAIFPAPAGPGPIDAAPAPMAQG